MTLCFTRTKKKEKKKKARKTLILNSECGSKSSGVIMSQMFLGCGWTQPDLAPKHQTCI